MADIPTCDWKGSSGQSYRYWVYSLPASFDPDQIGNYIYAKTNAQGYWAPIYIGQGDLDSRANNHHQGYCLQQKGATHFHCHINTVERKRLAEEDDLLENYLQAYQPTGCNERRGG